MAFPRRFWKICLEVDYLVFTSLDFATIIIYSARSSALRLTANLEDQVPVFMWSSYTPRHRDVLFVAFYDSQSYGGGILTHLHMEELCDNAIRSSHTINLPYNPIILVSYQWMQVGGGSGIVPLHLDAWGEANRG
jgi:hypothetical protein